ncbi:hypothetical protein GLAREA_12200 [Glarea lozoyensis ATCC 20868]|uniref:2EXR domain-containing protein n=1 Tax=Glarea lozoyensis (strain ATCC 20868 / MF5171) TaxID=1116229 RepID=S3E0R8_GLAL2|nr:uncharacterized protein GLAREA_12200 [Glarea lozoyensis ATCC 20868]EPE32118.1 hypothetical protein GLAREA_12200 [Glarea lozoyensis ATCC 20868]
MSTLCVCASCTAARQSGRAPRNTPGNANTDSTANSNPGLIRPLPPPRGLPNTSSLSQNVRPPPVPDLHARLGWTPTHSSLINRRNPDPIPRTYLNPLTSTTSFPNFLKLPIELRVRIWAFSTPSPRVIELRTWKSTQSLSPLKISAGPHSVPSILHACRESRAEGLRIYQLEEIGISQWKNYHSSKTYIPWRYHPANKHADPEYQVSGTYPRIWRRGCCPRDHFTRSRTPTDLVMPYAPQRIYLDYTRDIIYLGPDFSPHFLHEFLVSPSRFLEISKIHYLALDRKQWIHSNQEALRNNLYTLRSRPIKQIYIVPDDCEGFLEDRWYYGKHALTFKDPALHYQFTPIGTTGIAKTAAENLQDWVDRVWPSKSRAGSNSRDTTLQDGIPPKICIKSVRRAGMSMSDYKEGVMKIQRAFGGMEAWRTWSPAEELQR